MTQPEFLPVDRAGLQRLGWDAVDVLLVTGDAYVDHPAFGAALLGRHLLAHGWRVGIIAQPRWDTLDELTALGRPRLWAGVTAGALDSMLARYTAFRRPRRDDAYTPGGLAGARPERATLVYANLVRQAFPGLPLVLGGIEASLRRASHYDFWSNSLRRPLGLDARADLLVCGMAERAVLALTERLDRALAEDQATVGRVGGRPPLVWRDLPGCAFIGDEADLPPGAEVVRLPGHEQLLAAPAALLGATLALERQAHQRRAWAIQPVGDRAVLFSPPAAPLTPAELDALYALPFTRRAHPSYTAPVPAEAMLRDSLTAHRGCAGGCSFCSLALHQGRTVSSRSRASLLGEAAALAARPGFSGSLSDVGGPSANMWGARCTADPACCERSSCLTPAICRHFSAPQRPYLELLGALARLPGIRHVRVGSGIRHDLLGQEPDAARELVRRYVGGQLKLAPEHSAGPVLRQMRKPSFASFLRFLELFGEASARAGKEQYVVPYLMSAFPGCTEEQMRQLADWLASRGWRPQQVQCFVPTPGTVATALFWAGIDEQGRTLTVARTDAERRRQHQLLVGDREEPAARQTGPRRPPGSRGKTGRR